MPEDGKLLVGHFDVLREKLNKVKERIKAELEKDKKERDSAQLKKMLRETKSLKKVVKQMEHQLEIEEPSREALFIKHPEGFEMPSGGKAFFEINSKAMIEEDINTLAWIIAQKTKRFAKNETGSGIKEVHGVNKGGKRLAKALKLYKDDHGIQLIIGDVLSTGQSMEEARKELGWTDAVGVVIFARNKCPDWIKPMFEMHWLNTKDI